MPNPFGQEAFWGFDLDDSEVGEGDYRHVAIELKHLFESMVQDADKQNEECFIAADVEQALRMLMADPSQQSLDDLLKVSPALIQPVETILKLVTPRMFEDQDL